MGASLVGLLFSLILGEFVNAHFNTTCSTLIRPCINLIRTMEKLTTHLINSDIERHRIK